MACAPLAGEQTGVLSTVTFQWRDSSGTIRSNALGLSCTTQ
jgi:hypothetical protein